MNMRLYRGMSTLVGSKEAVEQDKEIGTSFDALFLKEIRAGYEKNLQELNVLKNGGVELVPIGAMDWSMKLVGELVGLLEMVGGGGE